MVRDSISVAMAAYNGEKFLRAQIESILNQSLNPGEIIVCDDKSTDQTEGILREYASKGVLKYFINGTTLGPLRNFQRAISLCSGTYIALSDQDDVWLKDKLKISLREMQIIEAHQGKPSIVYGDLELVDENLSPINSSLWKQLRAIPERDTFNTLLFGNVVTGCTLLMNRPMANHLRNVPEEAIMHDYWAALIAYGFGQVGIVSKPLVKYRQHSLNVTDNYRRNMKNRIAAFLIDVKYSMKNNQFLKAEIAQAKQFQRLFNSMLSAENKRELSRFVALENAGFLKRKWKSFQSNLYFINQ